MTPEQHTRLYPGSGQDWEGEAVVDSKLSEPVPAASILQSGLDSLLKNAALRDSPKGERSAPRAAAILTAWTGREWSAIDVWKCLVAVKMAREAQGAVHIDDYIDAAAYFSLLGEEVQSQK